jgi:phenylalanyl-tRNA synthetase beta chain
MLNMVTYNLNRGIDNVRLFELGKVYQYSGPNSVEIQRASIGATGTADAASVNQAGHAYSFYHLKGDIEILLECFEHTALHFDSQVSNYYHPGRAARAVMDGDVVAEFGQIHPNVASARKLRQDVFVGELFLHHLYQRDLRSIRYEALSRYPSVQRDFSFIFDDSVIFDRIQNAAIALNIRDLRRLEPIEIFRGGSMPKGKYSLLLRAIFQSSARTLRDDEVAAWSSQIIKALEGLGGALRA